jgi:hypothetical protein
MRKERRLEKLRQKGLEPEEVKSKKAQEVNTLEQFLQTPASAKHKFEVIEPFIRSQTISNLWFILIAVAFGAIKPTKCRIQADRKRKL